MKKYMLFAIRLFVLVLGGACVINSVVLSFASNFDLGIFLILLLGITLVLCSICFEHLPLWIQAGIPVACLIFVGFAVFLLGYGRGDTVDYREDALIVLGAAVHKDCLPSLILQQRLDIAIEYHKYNPTAIIVVSGGKGEKQRVSEAEIMFQYLTEQGVPEQNIFKEEHSTSTYENFYNSKVILDRQLGRDYRVAVISHEFHIYRARGMAKKLGIDSVTHLHCITRWRSILPSTLRECLAVIKFWILGN